MNKEEKAKRILTTTGYMTQLEKSIVYSYIEELEQKLNQLETSIATKELQINANNIRNCCRNKRYKAGGFIWRYMN